MKVCILYDPGLRCSHPTSFDGGRNWLTNPRERSISHFSNRSSPDVQLPPHGTVRLSKCAVQHMWPKCPWW